MMTEAKIEFSSGIPVYRQIINMIYAHIGTGTLKEGERLPTIKELTERLGVNPNTIAKAYRELEIKGVIMCRRGDGSFVSAQKNGTPVRLTAQERKAKLGELFGRLVAEAEGAGITEMDLLAYVKERMKENE
jgi:GntR family transcriptional regulator